MSYSRLNLSNGQAFTASHVTHMEDGIVDCENRLDDVDSSLTKLDILTDPGTAIPSDSDMNNYTVPGKYYTNTSAINNTVENVPRQGAGRDILHI